MPSWVPAAVYEGNTLKLMLGDDVTTERDLTQVQTQRISNIIDSFDKEAWRGFHVCLDVLDGDVVNCRVDRDDGVLRFHGSNGSPRGFTALPAEIDSIAQEDFFPTIGRSKREIPSSIRTRPKCLRSLKPNTMDNKSMKATSDARGASSTCSSRGSVEIENLDGAN